MSIEEVIERVIMSQQTIAIEYCTRNGKVFTCEITDIGYSNYYGGGYIVARRTDMGEDRTFKVSRILSVNGHSFSRIFWQQIGGEFKRIY